MRDAIDAGGRTYPEYLPALIRDEESLVGIEEAIEAAHFPDTFERRDGALRRLAFDELFALQLGMVERRRQRGRSRGAVIAVDDERELAIRSAIAEALGTRVGRAVELTPDQESAMATVRRDIAAPEPMLRLIQGDVGSGKTAVAAHALAIAAIEGKQGALLAPTDLLARQHLSTVGDLLAGLGIPVTLLTGSLRERPGRRRRRDARPAPGAGDLRGTRARRHRRAAPVRGRATQPARGEGGWNGAARPAHDRDPDPADARSGPLRGP